MAGRVPARVPDGTRRVATGTRDDVLNRRRVPAHHRPPAYVVQLRSPGGSSVTTPPCADATRARSPRSPPRTRPRQAWRRPCTDRSSRGPLDAGCARSALGSGRRWLRRAGVDTVGDPRSLRACCSRWWRRARAAAGREDADHPSPVGPAPTCTRSTLTRDPRHLHPHADSSRSRTARNVRRNPVLQRCRSHPSSPTDVARAGLAAARQDVDPVALHRPRHDRNIAATSPALRRTYHTRAGVIESVSKQHGNSNAVIRHRTRSASRRSRSRREDPRAARTRCPRYQSSPQHVRGLITLPRPTKSHSPHSAASNGFPR